MRPRKWRQKALALCSLSRELSADSCRSSYEVNDNFYILAYEEIPGDKNIRVVTTVGGQS